MKLCQIKSAFSDKNVIKATSFIRMKFQGRFNNTSSMKTMSGCVFHGNYHMGDFIIHSISLLNYDIQEFAEINPSIKRLLRKLQLVL